MKQLEEKVIAKSTDEKAVIAKLEAIDGDIKKKRAIRDLDEINRWAEAG